MYKCACGNILHVLYTVHADICITAYVRLIIPCIQHDSSSKRYGQHLVYKKERAVWGSLSRHSSSDYAPCVEAYQKKKWCLVCNVKVLLTVHVQLYM